MARWAWWQANAMGTRPPRKGQTAEGAGALRGLLPPNVTRPRGPRGPPAWLCEGRVSHSALLPTTPCSCSAGRRRPRAAARRVAPEVLLALFR